MPPTKFQIGDRVSIYGYVEDITKPACLAFHQALRGEVVDISAAEHMIRVHTGSGRHVWCHVKQCRKVVPKIVVKGED